MKNFSARPVVPIIVCYSKSRITIGAWAILQMERGHFFVFFVKPKTRTYDWLKIGEPIDVYFDDRYKIWAESNDEKMGVMPETLFVKAKVATTMPIGGHKLFICPVDEMRELKQFSVLAYQEQYIIDVKEKPNKRWKKFFRIK